MLIDELLEKARSKLESAEYLFRGGFFEDASGRAYYSMYFAARALLSTQEIYPKTHSGLITRFGLEFVKEGYVEEIYGRSISQARNIRESADYGIDVSVSKEEAADVIKSARKFLHKIEEVIEELGEKTKEKKK